MDPITHGLTGALIGKALFAGERRTAGAQPFASQRTAQGKQAAPLQGGQDAGGTARVAVWVCTVAAMFPDVDVFFEPFVQREMATLELHRGVTHSLVCLPLFVAAMATLTWWWVRCRARRSHQGLKPLESVDESARLKPCPPEAEGAKQETRSVNAVPHGWWMLAGMWTAGIASHIVLDGATSWGTMLWAPLSNARATWDWVFILDFVLTGIVLLPQVAAWVYARRAGAVWRAAAMWAVFAACVVGVGWVAARLEAPLEPGVIPVAVIAIGAILFGPMLADRLKKADRPGGLSYVSRAGWCRAGLVALVGYYGLCAWMHARALGEVREFAAAQQVQVDALGALPMPPGATRWLGLIRTPEGVYRAYFSVAANPGPRFEYIADDKVPEAVARAVDALPEVQTYRWFARFPVMSYREEGGRHVVELVDHRFYPGATSRPAPFQYRVVVNAYGEVEEQGWIE
jgi:membrane-bound metal-dependent hydrolase YbcI (DUF457 family)